MVMFARFYAFMVEAYFFQGAKIIKNKITYNILYVFFTIFTHYCNIICITFALIKRKTALFYHFLALCLPRFAFLRVVVGFMPVVIFCLRNEYILPRVPAS